MNPTVSLADPWAEDDRFEAAAMPGLVVALVELFCSDSDSAAEFSSPVKPEVIVGVACSGCSGCVGSELRVRDTPNLSWASVASITVRSQSQVGLRCDSRYSCGS